MDELKKGLGIGPARMLEVSNPGVIDDNHFADPRIPYGCNSQGVGK